MENEIIKPVIRGKSNYCGYYGFLIEGTKHLNPRGYFYNLVIITPDQKLVFGREQGNYGGGITLKPDCENYEIEKIKKLDYIKTTDSEFYKLIVKNIQ